MGAFMYMLTIPDNSSSNCFDCVFYSYLKYLRLDYEAYNFQYFYTNYYNEKIGRIVRGKVYGNILNTLYQIQIRSCWQNKAILPLYNIIINGIKEGPVGVTIDPYFCHWSPFYQKAHYSHALLVVDVDERTETCVCFDVHYNSSGYVKVPLDVLDKNHMDVFTFHHQEMQSLTLEKGLDYLKMTLEYDFGDFNIKKEQMLQYFLQNGREVLFPNGIETSISLINLMWIAEDKRHFPIALKWLEQRWNKKIFTPVYELAILSEKSFMLLKSLLIKYAITNSLKERSLYNVIDRIFELDMITIEQIKRILRKYW